jgi:hypothetical protein
VVIVTGKPLRPFGTPHRRPIFVPVPVFYPIYGGGYDPGLSIADPSVQAADPSPAPAAPGQSAETNDNGGVAGGEDALRQAYIQGVRDALAQQQPDSRYGQHYLDARESVVHESPHAKPLAAERKPEPEPHPATDDSPSTVFIFKDGHQLETRNYAIMGQTLYDFSTSSLRKVELDDLDATATLKANDDRGITVKLQ